MAKDNEGQQSGQAQNEKSAEQLQAERLLESQLKDGTEQATLEGEYIQAEAVPSEADAVQSLAGLLGFIGLGFKLAGFENVSKVWTNQQQNNHLASVTVPVLAKHAWGRPVLEFLNGKTAVEELALFMALIPLGVQTYAAYNSDMQAKKQAAKEAENPAPTAENNAANPVTENTAP